MAENGYHGVHKKLVERYGRAGDARFSTSRLHVDTLVLWFIDYGA